MKKVENKKPQYKFHLPHLYGFFFSIVQVFIKIDSMIWELTAAYKIKIACNPPVTSNYIKSICSQTIYTFLQIVSGFVLRKSIDLSQYYILLHFEYIQAGHKIVTGQSFFTKQVFLSVVKNMALEQTHERWTTLVPVSSSKPASRQQFTYLHIPPNQAFRIFLHIKR